MSGDITVWSEEGVLLPGWPVLLPRVNRFNSLGVTPSVRGSPSLADLDGDGRLEIAVTAANGLLHVFRLDGTNLPGFPFDLNAGMADASDPVFADVDHDGTLEVIATGQRGGQLPVEEEHPPLHVVRADGTEQPGFPRQTGGKIRDGVAVADLDGDGELWIIGAEDSKTETIMVWNARTGEPRAGFPVFNGVADGAVVPPTVGDVTGDGHPDIVLAQSFVSQAPAMLFAWDRFGNRIQPYPLRVFRGRHIVFSAATLTDLDDDGLIDVMPTERNLSFPFSGRLHALTLSRPFDARTLEWPTDSHDFRHTGLYEPPVDELLLWGEFTRAAVFLTVPPGRLVVKLHLGDRRADLAWALAEAGLQVTAINDRHIAPLPGRILARPGRRALLLGKNASRRPDLIALFNGRELAAAILERLRKAGVAGGEERRVRLKIESPLQQRRRLGGEVRLRVLMPPGG
ncbi:MAG: FG-GAP repeat domain-containing protein [Acidobacteriota bacterium]